MAVLPDPPVYELGKLGASRVFISWLVNLKRVLLSLAEGTGFSLSASSRAVVTDAVGNLATSSITATELGYLSAATGNIQNQIDAKAPIAAASLTGATTAEQLAITVRSLKLPVLGAEPGTPADGEVVYANGTGWDPGAGAGIYGRVGGAWVKL